MDRLSKVQLPAALVLIAAVLIVHYMGLEAPDAAMEIALVLAGALGIARPSELAAARK